MTRKCEEFIEGRPLRVAGGFPCPNPARFVIQDRDGKERKVCGVHKNNLLKHHNGWLLVGTTKENVDAG